MMSRSICILRTSRLRSWLLYYNEYDLPMCSTFLTAERDRLTTYLGRYRVAGARQRSKLDSPVRLSRCWLGAAQGFWAYLVPQLLSSSAVRT